MQTFRPLASNSFLIRIPFFQPIYRLTVTLISQCSRCLMSAHSYLSRRRSCIGAGMLTISSFSSLLFSDFACSEPSRKVVPPFLSGHKLGMEFFFPNELTWFNPCLRKGKTSVPFKDSHSGLEGSPLEIFLSSPLNAASPRGLVLRSSPRPYFHPAAVPRLFSDVPKTFTTFFPPPLMQGLSPIEWWRPLGRRCEVSLENDYAVGLRLLFSDEAYVEIFFVSLPDLLVLLEKPSLNYPSCYAFFSSSILFGLGRLSVSFLVI